MNTFDNQTVGPFYTGHDSNNTHSAPDSYYESYGHSSSPPYNPQGHGMDFFPVVPDSSSMTESDDGYKMVVEEDSETSEMDSEFHPRPFLGTLPINSPTQVTDLSDKPYQFFITGPQGPQTVTLQVSKGAFESTFGSAGQSSAPASISAESGPAESVDDSSEAHDTSHHSASEASSTVEATHVSQSEEKSRSSTDKDSSALNEPHSPQADSSSSEDASADLFDMSVGSEEKESSALAPGVSTESSLISELQSSLSSSGDSIPPPPPSDSPPAPSRFEVIDPSGQDINAIASPRPVSTFVNKRKTALKSSNSSETTSKSNSTDNSLSVGSSPSLNRVSVRFNGSPIQSSSSRKLRGHVPSKVAMLVTRTVSSPQKANRRTTTLTNTFADAMELTPRLAPELNQDAATSYYGPLIQPPMLPPLQDGEKFEYMYEHPMDEKIDESGTFPAEGKFLVDLDISRVGPSLTMSLLAPRATLITNTSIGFLPASITALDLSENRNLTDACFSYLPSNLIHLDLRNVTQVSDDSLADLPRSLQYLNLRSARFITSNQLGKLPKTLTHLKLSGQNPNFKCDGLAKLPRMLRTLKIDYLNKMTKAASEQLPNRLTRLDLPRCLWIRDKAVSRLPASLTHLNLHSASDLSSSIFTFMPQNLTWLDIETVPVTNDQHLSQLPPTLENLHITLSQYNFTTTPNLMRLKVLVLNGPLDETVPLPKTLTAFKYICATSPSTCEVFASMLPDSLRFLDVMGVPWDDDSISDLPRELVWLSIQSTQLSSSSFPNFPPTLEYLRLAQMRVLFRSEELANLPHGLKYLHLDAHPHNKALLKTCPRYFPDWVPTTELAAAGEALFGAQDSCDGVGGGSSFSSFSVGSGVTSTSGSGRVDDPNLWTTLGQQEIDSHEPSFAADGALIHGAGYLYPFDYMDDSLNTVAWLPADDGKSRKKSKKAQHVPFDPSMASMSPFDIHLAARKVARRSLLPQPSDKAMVVDGDMTDQDISAGIKNVELVASDAVSVTPIGIVSLPPNIEYLDMRSVTGLNSNRSFAKTFKKKEDLIVANLESNAFKSTSGISKLSKLLTHLDLSSTNLGKDLIDLLPRSINYLALGCESTNFTVPPSLTALFLGNVHKVKESFISKLPRTIVYLDCYSALEVEPAALTKLPKNTLRYLNFHCLTHLPDYYFSCLPRHLVYLDLGSVEGITDRAIQALPRTLTHLDLSHANVTSAGIACLPSRLTHLSIDIEQSHDRLECIAYLPRQLRILNYGGDIKDPWFDFLPPNLLFLNLPFAYSMTPQFVANLPEKLIYFGAHSWTRALSDVPFSSTQLIYLDLYNADLSHTDWTALPGTLQYISSSSLVGRNAAAQNLPSYNALAKNVVMETLYSSGELYP